MVRSVNLYVAAIALVAGNAAFAACEPASFGAAIPQFSENPPALPDPGTRPEAPECLANISDPSQENCSTAEVEAYSNAIAAYSTALQTYVEATNRYANEAAAFANATVDYATNAREFADGALDWARCEADAINETAN